MTRFPDTLGDDITAAMQHTTPADSEWLAVVFSDVEGPDLMQILWRCNTTPGRLRAMLARMMKTLERKHGENQ